MKKGYSLVEFLIGILLSFFVLNLCINNFKLVKIHNDYNNQDLISSLQLHQIFNLSTNIEISSNEISFSYLNEERSLGFLNNKIILKPGTVIYFVKVDDCVFYVEDEKIFVKIKRLNKESILMIGIV